MTRLKNHTEHMFQAILKLLADDHIGTIIDVTVDLSEYKISMLRDDSLITVIVK